MITAVCALGLLSPAPAQKVAAPRSATLAVGQAINFKTGKVTRVKSEGDLVFQYGVPEDTSGMQFNAFTGKLEYRAGVKINNYYPILSAAKTGSFKTAAEVAKLTVGGVNNWTEDEYGIAAGRYIVVRALTTGSHHLVRITKLSGKQNAPKTWRLSFTHKPLALKRADAGGIALPSDLKGTLTFREWAGSNLVLDVDVSSGRVTRRFDGLSPTRAASGEYAYIDGANRIVVASPAGKATATLEAPAGQPVSFGVGGVRDAAISPDGRHIAVVVERSTPMTEGGITVNGIPQAHVVVIDRRGRELADFPDKHWPAWTPDGRLVMGNFGDDGLFLTDGSLRSARPVRGAERWRVTRPAVSPDGKRVAFEMNGRVWLARLDGSGLKGLAGTGLAQSSPVWSPDGRYIAIRTAYKGLMDRNRIEFVRLSDGKMFALLDSAGGFRDADGRISWR